MKTKKYRYEVHDGLGYLKSYTSRRRAEQAIIDIDILSQKCKEDDGISLWKGIFYIKDALDPKSVSIYKIE